MGAETSLQHPPHPHPAASCGTLTPKPKPQTHEEPRVASSCDSRRPKFRKLNVACSRSLTSPPAPSPSPSPAPTMLHAPQTLNSPGLQADDHARAQRRRPHRSRSTHPVTHPVIECLNHHLVPLSLGPGGWCNPPSSPKPCHHVLSVAAQPYCCSFPQNFDQSPQIPVASLTTPPSQEAAASLATPAADAEPGSARSDEPRTTSQRFAGRGTFRRSSYNGSQVLFWFKLCVCVKVGNSTRFCSGRCS